MFLFWILSTLLSFPHYHFPKWYCTQYGSYICARVHDSLKIFKIWRVRIFGSQDLTKEIIGDSRVVYDDKRIIEGNFTRKFSVYENRFIDDAIDLTVQNKMLPLGVRYLHRVNNESHVTTTNIPNIVSKKFSFVF